MRNPDERRKWHINKEVSLDAIVAFLSVCAAVVAAWVNLNSRLSVLETTVANAAAEAIKRNEDARISNNSLVIRLDRMDDKLDRLIERRK